MTENIDDTTPSEIPPDDSPQDPLGILGWVIGGKYKIHSYIGGGGFGEVYEGFNVNLSEQKLVIKFFKRVQSRDKFAKEAKILCLLDHPNICRIIDFLPEEGAVVVAFIDGLDGGAILKASGPLKEELFIKVARAMTHAIAYAHEKKIAHRDIKPSNIIVDKNENVYLIDFGIAKEMGTEATKTAYQALTPMFAAPERQTGEKHYNPFLSDIYETGITLFNFATNDMPYRNPVNPNIDEWGGKSSRKLSPQLRQILKKATHPRPEKRYKSAAELAEELKHLEYAFHRPYKFPIGVAVAVVLIIIAVAVYLNRNTIKNTWESIFPQATTVEKTKTEPQPEKTAITPPATDSTTGKKTTVPKTVTPEVKKEPEKKPELQTEKNIPKTTDKSAETAVKEQVVPETKSPNPVVSESVKETPPPITRYLVRVTPQGNSTVRLDNKTITAGQPIDISPGRHEITVVNSDYPLFRKTVQVEGNSDNLQVDLAGEYASINEVNLQLALIPPSEGHFLELTLNGLKKTIMSFPVLDFKKKPGEWEIETNIISLNPDKNKQIKIDSCVVFPYGGGTHFVIKGSRGIIKIVSEGQEQVPLLIFWTEK